MPGPPWLEREIGDALANVGAPAYILDRDGVVLSLNASAVDVFGDQRGRHFTVSVAPEAQAKARDAFAKKLLGTARTTDYESVQVLRSGEHIPVEIHSVAIENGGRVVGVFGIVAINEQRGAQPRETDLDLTPRQHEILLLLAGGLSTEQIAKSLGVTRVTVRNHIARLLNSLQVNSRIAALIEARRRGLID